MLKYLPALYHKDVRYLDEVTDNYYEFLVSTRVKGEEENGLVTVAGPAATYISL
jgi:hypothetical protein